MDKLSWRWRWWINLPCAGLAFVVLILFLENQGPGSPLVIGLKAIDWFGCLAILGSTTMFLIGLNFGGRLFPWSSPKAICLIVFGLLLVGLFFASEVKFAEYPVMPMGLFKQRWNVAALVVCFCHGLVTG
jgi:MFS family permease